MIIQATEKDFEKVYYVLSHESVYPFTTDDYCPEKPDKDLLRPFIANKNIKIVMPNEYSVFIFMPLLTNVFSMHMNILPEGRGRIGIDSGQAAMEWMFNNTKCTNIVSFIPSFNKPALAYASLIGLKRTGIIPQSFKKNGIFYDQIIKCKGEV